MDRHQSGQNSLDSLQNVLSAEAKKQDSTLHVDIDAFYEGNRYYATTYQDFTDLRLVFTVPKSMGKFGGETDNGCGRVKLATLVCLESTPIRTTDRLLTIKIMCLIIQNIGRL